MEVEEPCLDKQANGALIANSQHTIQISVGTTKRRWLPTSMKTRKQMQEETEETVYCDTVQKLKHDSSKAPGENKKQTSFKNKEKPK
jgi:hypothetical protein